MVHVNINCSSYERSKLFYKMLGFEEVWVVPKTNTPEVNAAVGMGLSCEWRHTRFEGLHPARFDRSSGMGETER